MAYRVYFCNCPVLGEPSDIALEDAVPFDFPTEADAITICGKFLGAGLVFPVALEYPDGTRLSAQEIEDRCFSPSSAELSRREFQSGANKALRPTAGLQVPLEGEAGEG